MAWWVQALQGWQRQAPLLHGNPSPSATPDKAAQLASFIATELVAVGTRARGRMKRGKQTACLLGRLEGAQGTPCQEQVKSRLRVLCGSI